MQRLDFKMDQSLPIIFKGNGNLVEIFDQSKLPGEKMTETTALKSDVVCHIAKCSIVNQGKEDVVVKRHIFVYT